MWKARLAELLALVTIGDGMATLVQPERHFRLWLSGPQAWQRIVRPFAERPGLTRWLGLLAVAAGLWLASRQRPPRAQAARHRTLQPQARYRRYAALR